MSRASTRPSSATASGCARSSGYAPREQVCIVTVGGSGVGRSLLERVIAAFPEARQRVPELRMIVVAGPRIDPASLPAHDGLEVRAFVPDLYRHLAACDLAVVQGGLTTSMELTANRRPFLYFPLRHHFEQNTHVRHRLERYGAGRCMDFETAMPDIDRRGDRRGDRPRRRLPARRDGRRRRRSGTDRRAALSAGRADAAGAPALHQSSKTPALNAAQWPPTIGSRILLNFASTVTTDPLVAGGPPSNASVRPIR